MRPIKKCFDASLLLAIALLLGPPLAAQTLEHRSPARDEMSPPVTPSTNTKQRLPPAKSFLPQETNLQVETIRHYPMKDGEMIEGRLLFPVFAGGKLVIPQNTLLQGTVIALLPDKTARWHARLRGDFTPFHMADVRFNELMLAGGPVAIATGGAAIGSPIVHLSAPAVTPRQSVFARYWKQAKNQLHDRVAYFTSPGLGDRALQMLYHQLPWHPERIEAKTTWSIDLNIRFCCRIPRPQFQLRSSPPQQPVAKRISGQ